MSLKPTLGWSWPTTSEQIATKAAPVVMMMIARARVIVVVLSRCSHPFNLDFHSIRHEPESRARIGPLDRKNGVVAFVRFSYSSENVGADAFLSLSPAHAALGPTCQVLTLISFVCVSTQRERAPTVPLARMAMVVASWSQPNSDL